MKKVFSIFLCLAIIISLPILAIPSNAEEEQPNDRLSPSYLLGDLDNNTKISAVDARICLRASAELVELTEEQKQAADVFFNGDISAVNARRILRVSAKLDLFEIPLQVGETYVLPPLNTAGSGAYQWECKVSPSIGIEITETRFNPNEGTGIIGGPVEQTFSLLAQIPGSYTVNLKLGNSWEDKPINELSFKIKVAEVELEVGESYTLPPLLSAANGDYAWTWSFSPDMGLDIKTETKPATSDLPGAHDEHTYTFLAQIPGSYTITLELKTSGDIEPVEELSFTIKVNDIKLEIGESFTLMPLETPATGMIDWHCTVTPDKGLDITSENEYPTPLDEGDENRVMTTSYTFTAQELGTYTVNIKAVAPKGASGDGEPETIIDITFKIVVEEQTS